MAEFAPTTVPDVDGDTAEVTLDRRSDGAHVVGLSARDSWDEVCLDLSPSAASHLAGVLLQAAQKAVQANADAAPAPTPLPAPTRRCRCPREACCG